LCPFDVFNYVGISGILVFVFWFMLDLVVRVGFWAFGLLTYGVYILYIILLLYTYTILFLQILSSFPSFFIPPISPQSLSPSFILYVSVLTSTYLYSKLIPPTFDPACFIGVDGWGV
jgi:hypothetical protein